MISASPEMAYNEVREKLKSCFGRPAIIATDFENNLANWPKIGNNDAWWKSSQLDLNKMVHNSANPSTKESLRCIPDLC